MTAAPVASPWRRVAVGIDFSESSLAAATWVARDLAPGAELVFVYVIYLPEPPSFLRGRYPPREQIVELARVGAEQRLRELVQSIATGLIWTEIAVGRPDEELARVAGEYGADLIVVGRHGERPGIWDRLGGTAERVLNRSKLPVLVVSGAPRTPPRSILAAVDESAATATVLEWTRALARRFDASATVLHVVSPILVNPGSAIAAGALMPPAAGFGNEADVREAAEAWLNEEVGGESAPRLDPVVAIGLPAQTILAEAETRGSELVVLGSRGAGTAGRLVLGSVSTAVLRGADRPVLVAVAREQEKSS
jgi:nucleotide-binding universal stress UspA family protein